MNGFELEEGCEHLQTCTAAAFSPLKVPSSILGVIISFAVFLGKAAKTLIVSSQGFGGLKKGLVVGGMNKTCKANLGGLTKNCQQKTGADAQNSKSCSC